MTRLQRIVLTIGHSTHPIGEFIEILEAHGVDLLADVRTIPRSRHNPQFNRDSLRASLLEAEMVMLPMPGLGGLRHARPDSPQRRGATTHFAAMPATCRPPNFVKTWTVDRTCRSRHK